MTQSGFVLPVLKNWSPFKNERMENAGSLKWQDPDLIHVETLVSLIAIHCYRFEELGTVFSAIVDHLVIVV